MQPDDLYEISSNSGAQRDFHPGNGSADELNSYDEILKSSALIGLSSVLSMGIAVIRTKALAVLLGPAGFGLISVYSSIADVTRSVAELGINNSGVRQIAAAVGSGDTDRIARTVTVLRRVSVLLGLLGAALLFALSAPVSRLTFGTDAQVGTLWLLSVAVFFRLVADGQGALIQGMRRISDLAKMGVVGALLGTVTSIPIVYVLREDGIVPFLVCVAAMSLITSWWYSRKVLIQSPRMTVAQIREETKSLLRLGLAFMGQLLLTMGSAYVTRIMVIRGVGLESTGLYQAAWTLGGLYCALIYQGIFTDFYPRLVGAASDNSRCNRMVNEQTRVALLLAGPGVLATLTFSSFALMILYTAEFNAAAEVLRWICLGATLRVIFQPMGFIIVAKGKQVLFFGSELVWTVIGLGLTWICLKTFGLNGVGIAFLGSFAIYGLIIYPIVRRLSGFRWSIENWKLGIGYLSLVAIVFGGFYALPPLWAAAVGAVATVLACVYSIQVLASLMSLARVPPPIRRLLMRFRLVRTSVK